MTPAMKIQLRLSQVRKRLNEIAGLEGDDFTDEIRSEAETLQNEYSDLEVPVTRLLSSPRVNLKPARSTNRTPRCVSASNCVQKPV